MLKWFVYNRTMKPGPNIAYVAALIGDPARANILTALMSGKALTATELAREAGVTKQTASTHLARLTEGGLIAPSPQGRHRYYSLAAPAVADILERLMGFAAGAGHLRHAPGPKDAELRFARVCYNHLAGDMGTRLFDSMVGRGFLRTEPTVDLTETGRAFIQSLGLSLKDLPHTRTPMCRACLDWSERRSHLAGRLGRGLLTHFETLGWIKRIPDTRVLRFSQPGLAAFQAAFPHHA